RPLSVVIEVIDPNGYFFFENLVGTLAAALLQHFQFPPGGQAGRRKLASLEVAGRALVEAVEQGPVHALEIKGEGQGLAHAPILELVLARIQDEGLHWFTGFLRKGPLQDIASLEGRKIILRRPRSEERR